mmetsp:Transcript_16108/g.43910  ORF Transcript_16108/g.43910 Transcript_16108/m.43910 type:complete len:233 (+) Transcript_16108:906-1604(+)
MHSSLLLPWAIPTWATTTPGPSSAPRPTHLTVTSLPICPSTPLPKATTRTPPCPLHTSHSSSHLHCILTTPTKPTTPHLTLNTPSAVAAGTSFRGLPHSRHPRPHLLHLSTCSSSSQNRPSSSSRVVTRGRSSSQPLLKGAAGLDHQEQGPGVQGSASPCAWAQSRLCPQGYAPLRPLPLPRPPNHRSSSSSSSTKPNPICLGVDTLGHRRLMSLLSRSRACHRTAACTLKV